MVRQAVEEALVLLDAEHEEIMAALTVTEPYRHRLYMSVTVAALKASEQAWIKREREYWRARTREAYTGVS